MTANQFKQADAGTEYITMAELDRRLAAIGYKRDADPCNSTHRVIAGPLAGESYPGTTYYVRHVESGLGFAHYAAPRDANFHRLQRMRSMVAVFSRGRIRTI